MKTPIWRDASDGGVRLGWSVDAVRDAEQATGELLTNGTLMQRAASGLSDVLADEISRMTGKLGSSPRVVVLVGPGNNGGDALYAARNLAAQAVEVTAVLVASSWHVEASETAHAAGVKLIESRSTSASSTSADGSALRTIENADLVVDGILGIGASQRARSPWDGEVAAIPQNARVVAVDVPTPGITAHRTVTFGLPKTSLMLAPSQAGEIDVVDIGLNPDGLSPEAVRLTTAELANLWKVPGPADHKYTRGVVGLATGSNAYPGAAVLGAVAGVTAGAGMVRYLGPSRPSDAVLAAAPEVVHGDGRVQAWVVGSGVDPEAEKRHETDRYRSIMDAFEDDVPVVVDAGALAWLQGADRSEGAATVLTPHAGELATLMKSAGHDVERQSIEADPIGWARRAADEFSATVLLKGGSTVVASPGQEAVLIENRAPHWLATAGTGDVLAALVGVQLAAGHDAKDACALAAYLHGRAGRLANPDGPIRALDVAHALGKAGAELTRLKASATQPGRESQ